MSYTYEDICEDYRTENHRIASSDYDTCQGCGEQVHVDNLTEESICDECKPDYYCRICGKFDDTMKDADTDICEECELAAQDLEQADDIELSPVYMVAVIIITALMAVILLSSNAFGADWKDQGRAMTKNFEGYSSTIYPCPSGKPTIGYGINLLLPSNRQMFPQEVLDGRRAITKKEANRSFDRAYDTAISDAKAYLGDSFKRLSPMRKAIITDMAFTLGKSRIKKFKRLKAAIVAEDYDRASAEIKDSLWYRQTGRRGRHHVRSFR